MRNDSSTRSVIRVHGGIGLGTVAAGVISWMTNHSIAWCILHALCGWFYVLYPLCGCGGMSIFDLK